MSDLPAIRRQLRIKSGVVSRLTKETTLYRKEAEQLETKRDKFIADGAENWDIGNSTRMAEESRKMVQDTITRLTKAVEDLETLITSAKKEPALAEDEELRKAVEILEKGKA
ncbi:tubulin binding cofactor A [Crassisporium funariophilum]|nr:tubulin binding cofactor A [Crassisporium funariophilum]